MTLGVYPNRGSNFTIVDSLIVAAIAIAVVFIVLIVIILVCGGFQKGIEKIDAKTKILPKEENKLLEEDEDAVAAALAATIEFNKETGKDARLVSIKKIED